jgi:hypothetical protein
MAKKTKKTLKRVIKLSESMNIDSKLFIVTGVLDPILGVDVKVFIDPQRLLLTKVPEFKNARASIEKYFADTFRLIKLSSSPSDPWYKKAVQNLTFNETKGVGIGFGRDTDDGRGIGPKLARRLVDTATIIHGKTIDDPAVFELLGLFEDDFGPDRLSDLTIYILRKDFLRFTARVSKEIGLTGLQEFSIDGETFKVPFRAGTKIPLTLLPLDLIRELPIATDPNEIKDASYINAELRKCWRDLVSKAYEAGKQHPEKDVTRQLFLDNPQFFAPLIEVYRKNQKGPYDFVKDPKGILSWADFAMEFASQYPLVLRHSIKTSEQLEHVVSEVIDQFARNIETNGLNKLLFKPNGQPQREAFAQLLFFASADAYCRANGLDLSPESDAGRGPVDFKISKGRLKVVVEIKLSKSSRILHGFQEQLEIYKAAESAQHGFYVIVRVSDSTPPAIEEIKKIIATRLKKGELTSKLKIVDGVLHPSASKPQKRKRDRP